MPTVNVQFREDPEIVAFLERRGLKPGRIAKEAFEREVRRMRAEDLAKELASFRIKLPKGMPEKAVREARDAR